MIVVFVVSMLFTLLIVRIGAYFLHNFNAYSKRDGEAGRKINQKQ